MSCLNVKSAFNTRSTASNQPHNAKKGLPYQQICTTEKYEKNNEMKFVCCPFAELQKQPSCDYPVEDRNGSLKGITKLIHGCFGPYFIVLGPRPQHVASQPPLSHAHAKGGQVSFEKGLK